MVEAAESVLYRPVRESAWAGRHLVPRPAAVLDAVRRHARGARVTLHGRAEEGGCWPRSCDGTANAV